MIRITLTPTTCSRLANRILKDPWGRIKFLPYIHTFRLNKKKVRMTERPRAFASTCIYAYTSELVYNIINETLWLLWSFFDVAK